MSERTENVDETHVRNLNPDLVLHRVPDLKLHVLSDNRIQISLEEKTVTCGPHTLAILDTFHQPTSFSEALRRLGKASVGVQDWAALTSTIVELYRAGVLQDETQSRPVASYGFGSSRVHVRMLNDRTRTSSFLAGIGEVVTAGDVVVDIGTGTGVLAIAAARAGAKRVYAIEASDIGRTAKTVFEANGVADRITLLRRWSTRTTLPERADVLVSEIIGDDPLAEDVLQVTMDARRRLLKPEARLVPNKVKIFALPVSIPREEQTKHIVTEETLRNWRSQYGIDFGPLIQVKNDSLPAFYIKPQRASDWKALGEPILLAAIDLSEFSYPISLDNTLTIVANAAGKLDGLVMYFELKLGPTTRLSTAPALADSNNHWRSPVWVLGSPLPLQYGDRLQVACKYRSGNYRISVTRAYR
jgi:protein arginine N-methyltransferase 1